MSIIKADQKVKERSKGYDLSFFGCSSVFENTPKKSGLFLMHKSHNVELKEFFWNFPNFGAT